MSVPLALGWRHLLFANWPVDVEVVDVALPDAFDVETHDGDAWLSVVAFANVDVRVRGLPAWTGVDFPQVNLRTYARHDGEPGIYTFSLDAASLASVVGARVTHHLPYYYADVDLARADGRVRVRSRRRHPGARPARFVATYEPRGDRFEAEPGSVAAFLTERRRLWTEGAGGAIRYTDVSHERWPLYDADATVIGNTLFDANGFDTPAGEPTTYYSPGVAVVTTASRRWEANRTPAAEPSTARPPSRGRPTAGARRSNERGRRDPCPVKDVRPTSGSGRALGC